jgi:ABC-2 type transport system permease protein
MIGYLVAHRAAHKVAVIVMSALPYGLLFVLCIGYFDRFPDTVTFLAFLLSLVLGFLIGFFFEACMGMIGFWFLEVTSILWVVNTVNFFVSGQMFPLEFLDSVWPPLVWILKALPFQYLAHFPCVVFLGKVQGTELAWGLAAQAGWALAMIALTRWLFRRGLRHYSAFGG